MIRLFRCGTLSKVSALCFGTCAHTRPACPSDLSHTHPRNDGERTGGCHWVSRLHSACSRSVIIPVLVSTAGQLLRKQSSCNMSRSALIWHRVLTREKKLQWSLALLCHGGQQGLRAGRYVVQVKIIFTHFTFFCVYSHLFDRKGHVVWWHKKPNSVPRFTQNITHQNSHSKIGLVTH